MDSQIKKVKQACALTLQVWRAARGFFISIEVWLMVVVAFATVAGCFLAAMGRPSSLLVFGAVIAYLAARPILHYKGILRWPFL